VAVVAYVGLVGVLELLRQARGVPDPAELASSPHSLATGRVWLLLTSGLVVAGAPVGQLVGLAATAAVGLRVLGAATFWAAAIVAHVGSAVLAYAGVALLGLVDPGAVEDVVERADYGISCVWLGVAGALVAARMGTGAPVLTAAVAGVSVLLWVMGPSGDLAGVEHAIAFALGAAVAAVGASRV
jgi:hypothetical protein